MRPLSYILETKKMTIKNNNKIENPLIFFRVNQNYYPLCQKYFFPQTKNDKTKICFFSRRCDD